MTRTWRNKDHHRTLFDRVEKNAPHAMDKRSRSERNRCRDGKAATGLSRSQAWTALNNRRVNQSVDIAFARSLSSCHSSEMVRDPVSDMPVWETAYTRMLVRWSGPTDVPSYQVNRMCKHAARLTALKKYSLACYIVHAITV